MERIVRPRPVPLNDAGRLPQIRKVKEAPLDLDLLRFFVALMDTGALHRAAERLELSQPAASRALARLRMLLGDKLFVKSGLGMVPTPRAEALRPAVQEALERMEALVVPDTFDPAVTRRAFRVGMMDNALLVAVTGALPDFLAQAPSATLEICPLETDFTDQLREGRVDLVVFPARELPPDCHSVELLRSDYACLVRRDHPLAQATAPGERPALDAFRRYRRLAIKARMGSATWFVDRRAMPSLEDDPAAVVMPYFLGAPYLLLQTDLVLVLPRPTAEHYARALPLAVLSTPIPSAPFRPQLVWHHRVHADAGLKWLRALIVAHARRLRGEARDTVSVDAEAAASA